ncbi:hypothetical protein Tco_1535231 [Tanacetum coccineum]
MVISSPCLTDIKNWLVQRKRPCTTKEGLQAISATIDGHEKLITEDSLRIHLKLDDAEGISSLFNEEIFEHLAHMGYVTNSESPKSLETYSESLAWFTGSRLFLSNNHGIKYY